MVWVVFRKHGSAKRGRLELPDSLVRTYSWFSADNRRINRLGGFCRRLHELQLSFSRHSLDQPYSFCINYRPNTGLESSRLLGNRPRIAAFFWHTVASRFLF